MPESTLILSADERGWDDVNRKIVRFERNAEDAGRSADRLGRETTQASNSARRLGTQSEITGRSVARLGNQAQTSRAQISGLIGRFAALGLSVGAIGIVLQRASRESLNFERSIAEVATIAPILEYNQDALAASAIRLTRAYGGQAVAQIQGFYSAYSAGAAGFVDANNRINIANQLAIGGVAELGSSVLVLSSITNAYASFNLEAARASDLLFIAVRNGLTNISELSRSLSNVTSAAASLGLEFGTVTAAIAGLTAAGVPTAQATTQIRALLFALNRATPELMEYARTLGITSLAPRDLAQFLGQLNTVLSNTADQTARNTILTRFFGAEVEAFGAASVLSAGGFDTFNRTLDDNAAALTRVGEATRTAFGIINATDAQMVSRSLGSLNTSIIALGDAVNFILVPAFSGIANFAQFAADNIDRFAKIAVLTGVVAALPLAIRGFTFLARAVGLVNQQALILSSDGVRGFGRLAGRASLLRNVRLSLLGIAGAAGIAFASFGLLSGNVDVLTGTLQAATPVLLAFSAASLGNSLFGVSAAATAINTTLSNGVVRLTRYNAALRNTSGVAAIAARGVTRFGIGALGLLAAGGPIGIIAGLATGVASAIYLYRDSAADAGMAVDNLVSSQMSLNEALANTDSLAVNAAVATAANARSTLLNAVAQQQAELLRRQTLEQSSGTTFISGRDGSGAGVQVIPLGSAENRQEIARLQGQLQFNIGLLAETAELTRSVQNNIEGWGLPNDINRDLIRFRTELLTIDSVSQGIITRLQNIAPPDATQIVFSDAERRLAEVSAQVEANQILFDATRRRRFDGTDRNEEGFAILDNDITQARINLASSERSRDELQREVDEARARLRLQNVNDVREITNDTEHLINLTRNLGDAFNDDLRNGITSASDAFGDFFTGQINNFDDFARSIRNSWRQTVADLVSTSVSNNLLIGLGFGGLNASGAVGANAFGLLGDRFAGTNQARGAGFELRDAGRDRITEELIVSQVGLTDELRNTTTGIQGAITSAAGLAGGLSGGAGAAGGGILGGLFGASGATALTTVIAGALGAAAIVAVGAVVLDAAFGQRSRGSTFSADLSFNGGNLGAVGGQQAELFRNGFIRALFDGRYETQITQFTDAQNATIRRVYEPLLLDASEQARALGVTLGSINFRPVGQSFEDLTNEVNQQALSNGLAGTVNGIRDFANRNEELSETLARVSRELPDFTLAIGLITDGIGSITQAGTADFTNVFPSIGDASSATAGFFDNFFSDREQRDRLLASVGRQFNAIPAFANDDLPTNNAAFRELVTQQFRLGNNEVAASLIQISEAFADVTERSDELNASLRGTNREFSTLALERLAQTRPEGENFFGSAGFRDAILAIMNNTGNTADLTRGVMDATDAVRLDAQRARGLPQQQDRM